MKLDTIVDEISERTVIRTLPYVAPDNSTHAHKRPYCELTHSLFLVMLVSSIFSLSLLRSFDTEFSFSAIFLPLCYHDI